MSYHLTWISVIALAVNISATPKPSQPEEKQIILSNTLSPMEFLGDREENSEVIPWTYERILTWDDFQRQPQRGTDVVATTSTTLGISYQIRDGELAYSITCNFSKVKSWGSMKTDYILAHEQAHFDITEIIARRLHEKLQNYQLDKKTFRQHITRIYEQAVKDKEEMQEKYDSETSHSRNRKMQEYWLEHIAQLLVDTEHLETYP